MAAELRKKSGGRDGPFSEDKLKELNDFATKLTDTSDSKKGPHQRPDKANSNIRTLMEELNQDFETSLRNHMGGFEARFDIGMKELARELTEVVRGEVGEVKERIHERILDSVRVWHTSSKSVADASLGAELDLERDGKHHVSYVLWYISIAK